MEKEIVIDIHPMDPFYDVMDEYVGKVGSWRYKDNSQQGEGWYSGNFAFDGSESRYFHAIKTSPVGQKGEEKSTSTIPYGNLYKRKLRPRT